MSEELGDVDNTQVLMIVFIYYIERFGSLWSLQRKLDCNTTLRVSHSQIGRNAIVHTLYKLLQFSKVK